MKRLRLYEESGLMLHSALCSALKRGKVMGHIQLSSTEMGALLGPSSRGERRSVLEQRVFSRNPRRFLFLAEDETGKQAHFAIVRRDQEVFDVIPYEPSFAFAVV